MIEEELEVFTPQSKSQPRGPDWPIQMAEEPDRSDFLSATQPPVDVVMNESQHRNSYQVVIETEICGETQFNERDDLQSVSQIEEEIFSRSDLATQSALDHQKKLGLRSEPPNLGRLRSKKLHGERGVQSSHNVSKFDDDLARPITTMYEGSSNFVDVFVDDRSGFDIAL